jgi:GNAT superfamily N-acetyltransferase
VFDVPIAGWPELGGWFAPERPGPLIHQHLVRSGFGRCRVDHPPDPQIVLAQVSDNYALRGDPDRLRPADLDDVVGLVEAPARWRPALQALDPDLGDWPRLISILPPTAPAAATAAADVRRIGPGDAAAVHAYDPDGAWIASTWDGPDGLAAAGVGHGAFVAGRLAAVAVPFHLGTVYADVGVVTEAAHRGRGLSSACAAAVVADLRAAGLIPTWTTSPDNAASLAVAARLGFVRHREDVLYTVRVPIPTA